MPPSLVQLLLGVANTLNGEIASCLESQPYARGQMGTVGLLLILMAQEADRAVDTLVMEQDALKALFADAAVEAGLPAALRAELAAAAAVGRRSYRLADLLEQTAPLNALLIVLHETVERSSFDWAARLEARIWEILKHAAACRTLYLPTL